MIILYWLTIPCPLGIHNQEILNSETSGYNNEGMESISTEPGELSPHNTTTATEKNSEATDPAESTVEATTEATEEYMPPSSTDTGNNVAYTIDAITYVCMDFAWR